MLVSLFFVSSAFAGKITYCSNNGTNGYLQVFVMNEDGSGKKQLTNLNENCMRPKWSPDGKQIAFTGRKKGMRNNDIYLVNMDGANLRQLTNDWRRKVQPFFISIK